MRRAAIAVLIVGFMSGVMISGPGLQSVAAAASLKTPAHSVKAAKPGKKTVTYGGYAVSVPASWPVYDLAKDPRQCVRYDKHAVYLGTPGPDQDCPPGVVGRVDTISIGAIPQAPATLPGSQVSQGSKTGDRKGVAQTSQQAAKPGTVLQDPDQHALALTMPAASPLVDGTYGTNSDAVVQILTTIRPDAAQQNAGPGTQKGPAVNGAPSSARPRTGDSFRISRHPVIVKDTNPAWPVATNPTAGVPPGWLPPSSPPAKPAPPKPAPAPTGPVLTNNPTPAPPTTPKGTLAGFDTCSAPTLATMKAWRARYAATAVYIGGQMMGCGQGNLSAGWVQQAKATGWSLLPAFVGLQAPCDTFPGKINAKQAASQGIAAANQAVADAKAYGIGQGSPIYYDMEGYDRTNSSCHTAVLTFLDAWTRQLAAVGYVSGVYSSADSAIKDLQTTTTIAGHPLAEPKAVWIALWDNAADLDGTPYVSSAVWPNAGRAKQYQGNKTVKVGGVSLQIDADMVAGPVVRG
jgi:hypothetical protein